MATIGKVAISLEAQHAQFTHGVEKAGESLKQLGETAESIKGMIEGALAFVGIEAGVSALREVVGRTIESAVSADRLSSSLGITTESLQKLRTAGLLGAGLQADQFDGVLNKLVKTLGGAEEGSSKAVAALSSIGLSAKDLQGKGIDTAFTEIVDHISKISDPAARARAAVDLFGKSGQALGPLLHLGADGIKEFGDLASKLGVAMNDVDNEKLMLAHESMEKVGLAIQGLENRFTVALAPVLEALADKLLAIAPDADRVGKSMLSAFRYGAEGVGILVDAWHVLQLAAEGVVWVVVTGWESILHSLADAGDAIEWLAAKVMGTEPHFGGFLRNLANSADDLRKGLQQQMGVTADQLSHPSSEKWGKFFDDVQADAARTAAAMADKKNSLGGVMTTDLEEHATKIAAIIDKLQKQVTEFGLTAGQKDVNDLKGLGASPAEVEKAQALQRQLDALTAQKKVMEDIAKLQVEAAQAGMTEAQKRVDDLKRSGATQAQAEQATALQKQIDAAKEFKKDQDDAAKLIKDGLGDTEKFAAEADRIQKLVNEGLLTIAQGEQALDAAADKADKSSKDHEKGPAAQERRFDFRMPAGPEHAQDKVQQQLNLAKQHLDSAKNVERYQQDQWQWGLAAQQNQDQVVSI